LMIWSKLGITLEFYHRPFLAVELAI
jgi:hypothetical protein